MIRYITYMNEDGGTVHRLKVRLKGFGFDLNLVWYSKKNGYSYDKEDENDDSDDNS